jgi:hypothetical protein
MTSVLTATRDAMQIDTDTPASVLATRAAAWLKPLVARAGALINGEGDGETTDAQATADLLMKTRL